METIKSQVQFPEGDIEPNDPVMLEFVYIFEPFWYLWEIKKGDYVTQRTSSSFGRRAFAVAGPSEWNSLPVSVRHAPSIGSFKTKLKTHLFQIYYG